MVALLTTERLSAADNIGSIRFKESSAPSTPPSGYAQVYVDASGLLNWKDDAGTVYSFAAPPLIGTVSDTIVERDGALSPIWIKAYENTTNSSTAYLILQRSRGSKSSPAAVQSGDQLGVLSFRGYGTGFSGTRGAIVVSASELWTGSAHGTQMIFQTTQSGTTTLASALILHNNKRLEGFGDRSMKDPAVSGFAGSAYVEKQEAVQTTDATVTEIAAIDLAVGESIVVEGIILGFRSDFTEAVGGTFSAVFRRPTAGNVTLVGTVNTSVKEDSSGSPTFTLAADTGNQTVDIRVTGEAAKTFNWVVTYRYMKVLTSA